MSLILRNSIFFLLLGLAGVSAQDKDYLGYRIVGDEVVFDFNTKDYDLVTEERLNKKYKLNSIDIAYVAVAGNFNNWSRTQWKLKKIANDQYELRKKLTDFDDSGLEFKYVINGSLWAEPNGDLPNAIPAKTPYGSPLHTYNLRLFLGYPSEKGNVPFKLKGFKAAKKVILSGTFNKWSEDFFEMQPTQSGWALTLQLPPNTYEYKFIVDGEWMEDPRNPYYRPNEYDTYNSVVQVLTYKTFYLDGFTDAEEVILSGDFNNWDESKTKLTQTETGWTCTVRISGGKHHYKYIVDGDWILDPANSVREYDGDGNINCVVMVR
ncbi:MAG: hypothetical protein WBG71_11455 [Leeuwenhoekiella sp.]